MRKIILFIVELEIENYQKQLVHYHEIVNLQLSKTRQGKTLMKAILHKKPLRGNRREGLVRINYAFKISVKFHQ